MLDSLLQKLLKSLQSFLKIILPRMHELLIKLSNDVSKIQVRYVLQDVAAVLRSAGLFVFFNAAALFVFGALPQGRDVLRIVAEEINNLPPYQWSNLFWLLIGVFVWSIVAEYGTRYAIYVTDNSAKSLSEYRVSLRKNLQKLFSGLFLMLPYLMMMLGFAIDFFIDKGLTNKRIWPGYLIPIVLFYLMMYGITYFYFSEGARNKWRKKADKNRFLAFLLLPEKEQEWCSKLTGIYNDHVYTLPKVDNFNPDSVEHELIRRFLYNVTEKSVEEKYAFPQSEKLVEAKRVPPQFQLIKFTDESSMSIPKTVREGGQLRWIYRVPRKFYRTLHWQLRWIIGSSIVVFLIISFLSVSAYSFIGAAGLIALAFACWSGIYLGILYADYSLLRYSKLSLRFVLMILLLVCSFINNDHPLRTNNIKLDENRRPPMNDHFNEWLANYKTNTDTTKAMRTTPVIFVCAEGGALRTGGFTALMLSELQDNLRKDDYNFKDSVYAYTGVSGGSLGVGFFNAIAYLNDSSQLNSPSYTELSKNFFGKDFLAPVIGKMFYGDVLNLFLPVEISQFDRAAALEKSWENGYFSVLHEDENHNIFSGDFLTQCKPAANRPALLINTTEIESGLQCWVSNVRAGDSMLFRDDRDLLCYKLQNSFNYSTAVNFSTRFPLFSPAANVNLASRKLHYVDGGYAENSGAATMMEILKQLQPKFTDTAKRIQVVPYVIMLQFSGERIDTARNKSEDNVNFGNEVTEILKGIISTRSGRTKTAVAELERYVKSLNGKVIKLPLDQTSGNVPMNWVLSETSAEYIAEDIKNKWDNRFNNDLRYLEGIFPRAFEKGKK